MKTIRYVLAIALLLVAGAAAADGFFKPLELEIAQGPTLDVATKAAGGFDCAINVRYNTVQPTFLELTYIGASSCSAGQESAMTAASAANKVAVGGEPALDPVYSCAIMVAWNLSGPAAVNVVSTGVGCDATRATALRAAVPAVACMHRLTPCRP